MNTNLVDDLGGEWKVLGPLAYQGKNGCKDARCTRTVGRNEAGEYIIGDCMGWHCSYCDAPCSSQGHRCDAANAILGEARRAVSE